MSNLLPEITDLWLKTINWQPNDLQKSQFQQVYEQVIKGNSQFNLTRITEPIEFWEKH
ncbi:MAG: class I SAM-dependent methyltransferase, partial [Tatlockia sp.]|nr:class I SAM-dependent methyltransferase [Tatlockia sp.]